MVSEIFDNKIIELLHDYYHEADIRNIDSWRVPKSLFSYTSIYTYNHYGTTKSIVDDLCEGKISVTSPMLFNDIFDSAAGYTAPYLDPHYLSQPLRIKCLQKTIYRI